MKRGKLYKARAASVDKEQFYSLADAINAIKAVHIATYKPGRMERK